MRDTLLSAVVFACILILSGLVTNWFARTMYNRCVNCGTLNAKRRAQCRSCQSALP